MSRKLSRSLLAASLAIYGAAAGATCSPIVVDLNKDGINLGPPGVGVHFDVDNNGVPDYVQWVKRGGDEAFLALDRNGNGVIDDGSELFGVGTPITLEGRNAPNGFVGLAQYDAREMGGNDDGWISRRDMIWSELRLWRDANADGISTLDEMQTPEAAGLTAFQTIPRVHKTYDQAGNVLPLWGWAMSRTLPRPTIMVDVFFLVLPERMAYCTESQGTPKSAPVSDAVIRKS